MKKNRIIALLSILLLETADSRISEANVSTKNITDAKPLDFKLPTETLPLQGDTLLNDTDILTKKYDMGTETNKLMKFIYDQQNATDTSIPRSLKIFGGTLPVEKVKDPRSKQKEVDRLLKENFEEDEISGINAAIDRYRTQKSGVKARELMDPSKLSPPLISPWQPSPYTSVSNAGFSLYSLLTMGGDQHAMHFPIRQYGLIEIMVRISGNTRDEWDSSGVTMGWLDVKQEKERGTDFVQVTLPTQQSIAIKCFDANGQLLQSTERSLIDLGNLFIGRVWYQDPRQWPKVLIGYKQYRRGEPDLNYAEFMGDQADLNLRFPKAVTASPTLSPTVPTSSPTTPTAKPTTSSPTNAPTAPPLVSKEDGDKLSMAAEVLFALSLMGYVGNEIRKEIEKMQAAARPLQVGNSDNTDSEEDLESGNRLGRS